MSDERAFRRVALLGNHLPRKCGIATFTTDLSDAISGIRSDVDCFVLAMNDGRHQHAYPPRVRFELGDADIASYRRAADFLNVNAVDVVSLQHEYGIFGGKAGSHVLTLLRELRMPVVTTLHTILAKPNLHQRRVMDEITALSDRLVVMTARGAGLLEEVHHVDPQKIDLIPHGIPNIPFSGSKNRLGVEGRPLILTFGLLSPDKGIEYVIDALPAIVARYPDVVYIVLGATHPHIVESQGETYRLMLEDRAKRHGVDANVIFHNRFVSQAELSEFLAAADIYITPYLNPEQITSGTLAYAFGAGKAVISTPYPYAQELLGEGRGVLVGWRDASAIASAITGLLDDPEKRRGLRERAAVHGRAMLWPAVAHSYLQSFDRARIEHSERLHTAFHARTLAERPPDLPDVNLDHVRTMTDGTGMLQHATFNVPRYDEGYCLDDNARALLLMTLVEEAGTADDHHTVRRLASRYMAFVSDAFDRTTGRFKNFMSYARVWRNEIGSEDSHGRALWALGTVLGGSADPGRHSLAAVLFHAALPAVAGFSSPRAWAYALLGIEQYLRAFEGDRDVQSAGREIGDRLLGLFRRTDQPEWPWYETRVTYCNARLPQALIATGSWTGDAAMSAAGIRSLEWLTTIQKTSDGYFAPVGTNGFFERGMTAAAFDQQPVEACATVAACMHAFRTTGDHAWAEHARRAFTWFLGQNQLQQPLYDPLSGGCRDALHVDRVNENQGAESTLSFLLALMEMRADEVRWNAMQIPVADPVGTVVAFSAVLP